MTSELFGTFWNFKLPTDLRGDLEVPLASQRYADGATPLHMAATLPGAGQPEFGYDVFLLGVNFLRYPVGLNWSGSVNFGCILWFLNKMF